MGVQEDHEVIHCSNFLLGFIWFLMLGIWSLSNKPESSV
jgi:hypothetical protein